MRSHNTRSLILMGLGSMSFTLPLTGMAEGFIDDTKATLTLRNAYINRNYTNPDYPNSRAPQSKAEEWTQNFILDVKSGFTQGTVGFGVDVLGMYSQKLDGGKGTAGTQLLPTGSDGEPAKNFGRLGVAAKAKFSNTELKVGEWMPVLPILRSDDGRSLPQTFRGAQITSKEITNLNLYGGQFRANSPRNDASMEDMSLNGKGSFTSDRFNFAGGDYTFNEKRTQVGAWYAELENIYQQQFLNLIHSQPVGDVTLGANLGYFWGKEDGSKRAGELDNKTASALFSAKYKGNTLYVGLQRVYGDDGWFRVNGTSGGTLANDSYNSSYDLAKERSWQVRHDLDFAVLGVPGLTMMNRYISGSNIHTATTTDGKEWGRESELAYTVQSGTLKDLTVRWRNASIRRDYSAHEFDENRIFISYPLSLL
ncbi:MULTISPECIES: OprD family porin [unclassified Pseudomonas]|uniref:OprD family porin n=1 Tax=unclassified Pseudomonas TaxID=196821 RepID=UPI001295900E|nr:MULTISPECIES: OprD family porin [unclassified Pseudomonas]MQT39571.1 outer membrane porin, OprD family [Pseudomonas sp. FSL R10-0765]MQT53574.1 outer membrane porin, OprD family [Pseudomonas sp. FSL R10-2398]MQU00264.1 outer membrane porin, OprD family [Pseudomonas sp. FSL R10-2245]MQU12197.1 outer membrane porin, OprD family [Pseudomonas sp. FSL R10-2189]MQU36995.1 outer membrane porin, OprD family [Pseudomonas sp. FSL R10-2172]